LLKLAEELRVEFRWRDVDSAAVAYTHFLSWLALHGTLGDLAVALVVNLPVRRRVLTSVEMMTSTTIYRLRPTILNYYIVLYIRFDNSTLDLYRDSENFINSDFRVTTDF